jgi:hypothetical protein
MSQVDAFIRRMRVRQKSLYDTTVTLARSSSTPPVFDDATASYTPSPPTTIYRGPALIRPDVSTVVTSGGESIELAGFMCKLPVDTDAQIGDIVTVNSSRHDAGLTGLTLRVLDTPNDEWQIARRAFCVDQQRRPL